ncbi:hypothetical protein ACFYNL_39400 [Streptomyces sp. NPDC007808]
MNPIELYSPATLFMLIVGLTCAVAVTHEDESVRAAACRVLEIFFGGAPR